MTTGRVRSQYTNLVKMKLDQRSIKQTRAQIRNFRSEVAKMMKVKVDTGLSDKSLKATTSPTPRHTRTNLQDGHVRALRNQERFVELQQHSIDKFMLQNNLVRQSSAAEKERIRSQLLATNNAKQLRLEQLRIRTSLQDEHRQRVRISREMTKQNSLQSKFNSSLNRTTALLASAYLTANAFSSSMKVGIEMEGMEKSFLVISKDGREAAESMAWIREEANRLGTPLITASKGFAAMKAAAGDKMALGELKEIFTGVQEAGVALGLSQDDLGGITLAVKQIMSKGKLQAEEVTRQMGDRLPFAMRALAAAAVEVGLVSKALSPQEAEAAVFKLMENGKLIAHQILPQFGRELSKLARNNNELAKALDNNLSPALGRAHNNLTEMQKAFYDGLKPSVMFAVESFTALSEEGKTLAYVTGKFLGGAIFGVTTVVRFFTAALMDLGYIIKTTLNLTDEQAEIFKAWIPTALGAAAGVYALYKSIMMVVGALKLMKSAGDFIQRGGKGGFGGINTGGVGANTGGKKAAGLGKVVARGVARKAGQAAVTGARTGSPYAIVAAGGYYGGGMVNDALGGMEWYRNADRKFTTWINDLTGLNIGKKGYWENKGYTQDVRVKVDLDLNTENLNGLIDMRASHIAEHTQNNMLDGAMMNLSSGGY